MSNLAHEKGYGWKPGLPDVRDWVQPFAAAKVPDSVDLVSTGKFPPIWDQGQLGSCVAHGVPRLYVYDSGDASFEPARLFVYYNGRVIEGTVDYDSGLTIADGIKALNRQGAPPEDDWPYDVERFADKPPTKAYDDGKLREAVKYARVSQTDAAMRACLAAELPFAIGFTVYDSFESDATAASGVVAMPGRSEQVLGGHCMAIVGYMPGADVADALRSDGLDVGAVDTSATYYKAANSWSENWGHAGYCYMPSAYLRSKSLASDFWTVQTVSSPDPAPAPPSPEPTPDPTPAPDPTPTPGDTVDRTAVLSAIDELRARVAAL